MRRKVSRGFTIIEALVIIAIIGIVSSLIYSELSDARSKARDALRKSDMRRMANALEQYHLDHGEYPSTGGSNQWGGIQNDDQTTYQETSGPNGYIPNLAPDYIDELPIDPLGIQSNDPWSGYLYTSDGGQYKLLAMEVGPETMPEQEGNPFWDPQRNINNEAFGSRAWMLCRGIIACENW